MTREESSTISALYFLKVVSLGPWGHPIKKERNV
jgi:hypothetical protein